jgi:hypothetical protein
LILLVALLAGLLGGLLYARWQKCPWTVPPLRFTWMAIVAFLPQFFVFYLPATRLLVPDGWVPTGLVISQVLLLVFCWLNRRLAGVWLLALGLVLNLAVITANGGFMPISPQTASHLVPAVTLQTLQMGSRFGHGKDILLSAENTNLIWLSDRLLPPGWFPYQVAFSIGDVLIAAGAFWLMITQGKPLRLEQKE